MLQKIFLYFKKEPQIIILIIGMIMFVGGITKAKFLCELTETEKKRFIYKILGEKGIRISWIIFGFLFIILSICMFFI